MIRVEPSDREFDNAENVAMDIMSSRYPGVMTKAGSVVRELVIRPMAYLCSWGSSYLRRLRTESSAAYLKESSSTDNAVADALASNYFVTRRQGVRARGTITLHTGYTTLQLPSGATFSAGGTSLVTETRIIAIDSESYGMRNGIMYVPIVPAGDGTYLVSVPVAAVDSGKVEIAAGTEVTMEFASSDIIGASLTSPVTGGRDTETDAELMARAEYSTGEGGIGSVRGIRKKLDRCPVHVFSLNILDGEASEMCRGRNNWTDISPGGFLDCYVKTQNQPSVGVYSGTTSPDHGTHVLDIPESLYPGAYGVSELTVSGIGVERYDVEFSGDRLGTGQRMRVRFAHQSAEPVTAAVRVLYMPGIDQVQDYLSSDENRFVGQSVRVRAAVPVILSLSCAIKLPAPVDYSVLARVRQAISDCVNELPVGTRVLNLSDIRYRVAGLEEGADLRLPSSMTARTMLRNGMADSFYSNTGILDIGNTANQGCWDHEQSYFSLIPDNIRLELA